jgi:hypothetical protein
MELESERASAHLTSHPAIEVEEGAAAGIVPRRRVVLMAIAGAAVFGAALLVAFLVPRAPRSAVDPEQRAIESAFSAAPASATTQASMVPTQSASQPEPAAESPAAAAATAAPEEEPPATPPIPPGQGELQLPQSAAQHRIYVDGRVVSEGADPIRVACGTRSVRIGSAGRTQSVDVPCGGALALTR